jgi:energy-coupling factor transporter ATP-binding protein EcfA2
VAAEPDLPGETLEPVDIPIRLKNGFLSANLPSGRLVEGTPGNLVSAMHRLIVHDLAEGDPGVPFIHGATVVVEDRRMLLVGHKGCGKSTLALFLALAGHSVEGDEHLLLRQEEVVARPRTLRVKEGSLALMADIPAAFWTAPSVPNWDGSIIRSISPSLCGRPWVIRAGRLDAVVLLTANHGGRSVVRSVSQATCLRRLMIEVVLPKTGIAAAAARVQKLSRDVPAFELSLGELNTAEWHLQKTAGLLT